MTRPAVSLSLLALISILASGPVYAWGSKGHQIVAYKQVVTMAEAIKE